MPSVPKSMADLIVRSEYKLLRALYIGELQQIVHGVPYGIVRLADGMKGGKYDGLLYEAAAVSSYERWQNLAGNRIAGSEYISRERLLNMADEAKISGKYRRATQLYGWLLLTSRMEDNAKHWSLHHLQQIYAQHYAVNTPSH